MTFLCFDIGGTNTRVGISDDGETLRDVETFTTPSAPNDGIDRIVKIVNAKASEGVEAACGGIRGVLNETHESLEFDVVLKKWIGFPLADELSQRLNGATVFLENDTALAGLGEAHHGSGAGLDIVAYHTVSTGLGGVRIVQGAVDVASVGFEPGHQIVDLDRSVLGDTTTPTLENLVSGGAIESRLNTKPYDIPQSDVIWDELAEYLAIGLRNTTLYWSPDVIVLGGSMIVGDPKIELNAIRKHTVAALDGLVPCPLITTAKRGDASALYGALEYLRARRTNA